MHSSCSDVRVPVLNTDCEQLESSGNQHLKAIGTTIRYFKPLPVFHSKSQVQVTSKYRYFFLKKKVETSYSVQVQHRSWPTTVLNNINYGAE